MDRNPVLEATGVALVALVAWWGGVLHLDGALAAKFPYRQYETLSLLYPDAFYPALPGWVLAHAQPFAVGFWLVVLGWLIALPVAIGAGATKFASERGRSPRVVAFAFVLGLFVALTVAEAAVALLSDLGVGI